MYQSKRVHHPTMLSARVITAVLLYVAITAEGSNWAVLVTGSKTFDNYRHHADVAHACVALGAALQWE